MRRIRVQTAKVSLLVGVVLATGGYGAAGAQVRDQVSLGNLRFVGAVRTGEAVSTVLTRDDVALLVASRKPSSLNQLIAAGIPVRASRIQQLSDWGLMRQVGMEFQSLVPVLDDETVASIDRILAPIEPYIADDVAVAIAALHDRVWRHPGVPTLPVLTAWILRDRAWDHLSGPNGIDINAYVAEQRSHRPERGFWGLLWYSSSPPALPYGFYESRLGEYTVQVAWNRGEPGDPFAALPTGRRDRFLEKLERDGQRLDDAHEFPDLVEIGLIETNGDLRALARRYRVNEMESLARAVEQAAVDVASSFLSRVPADAIAQALGGVSPELAATIAYIRLVPGLVDDLAQRGLPVKAGDPAALWRELTGQDEEGDRGGGAVRVTMRGEGAADQAADPDLIVPDYSLMIWKELPTIRRMELPW